MRIILAIIIVLSLAGRALAGAECPSGALCKYFDPSGGSGGDGSIENPYLGALDTMWENASFISTVETAAATQDVYLFVKAGTTNTTTSTNRLHISFNGTASHLVTIDGISWDPGATGTRAKLYITGQSDNDKGVWIYNATNATGGDNANSNMYLKFYGFEVENYETSGNYSKTQKYTLRISNASYVWVDNCVVHSVDSTAHAYGISFTTPADSTALNTSHNKVSNCEIYSIGSSAIIFYNQNDDTTSDNEASNNYCHDFGWYFQYGTGILAMSATNTVIKDNYITDGYNSGSAGSIGIKLECRAAKPTNCVVERNLIVSSSGNEIYDGIAFQGTTDCVARNNILVNCLQYGFRIYTASTGDGAYSAVGNTGTVYENNTHYNITNYDIKTDSGNTLATLANNIFYRTNTTACINDAGSITSDYNNCYYNTGGTSRTCYSGGASYTYAQMPGIEATCQITDPGFVNTSSL